LLSFGFYDLFVCYLLVFFDRVVFLLSGEFHY